MARERRREDRITSAIGTALLTIVAGAAFVFLLSRFLPMSPSQPTPPTPDAPSAAGTPTPTTVAAPAALATPSPIAAPTAAGARAPAGQTAQRYLRAWEAAQYADMYKLLAAKARQSLSQEKFVGRYQAIMSGSTVVGLKASLSPLAEPPRDANRIDARFDVTFQTGRFGELTEHYTMPLLFEDGDWRVDWTPDLIFQGLAPDRTVRVSEDDPVRGSILDKNGRPLATQAKVPTLGVVPGDLKDREGAVNALAQYLQTDPKVIRQKIDAAQPDWWVPLGVFPPDKREELTRRFGMMPGVLVDQKETRIYPEGSVAAHIVGYVSPASGDDLKTLAAKGYAAGDPIGRAGVEASEEGVLAGQKGGRLVIADPNGSTVRVIAERPARPGDNVQLTIDLDVQRRAEEILGDKIGSLVMMDPRDNSIVAMASSPRFDPNAFIFGISAEDWKKLNDDPRHPFQNRPTMSSYPTGSIFKVITMTAGLERGGFTPQSQFVCTGTWNKLNLPKPLGDWVPQGHGRLDLSEGLTESCDIVFYDLGLKLYQTDPQILSDYAHQFGLGEPTGIQGLSEVAGIVPSEEWKQKAMRDSFYAGDEVNFAIGQGYFQATPLQMANVYSTLASGGHLRTPLLVRKIGAPNGVEPPKELKAQERRQVPASPQTLQAIREAMKRAASSPRGTAYYAFNGYRIPIAAKTGSAENENPDAHAWFAGYGPADDPRLVVLVMVEGGKLGGVVAAPMGRQAFEAVLGK